MVKFLVEQGADVNLSSVLGVHWDSNPLVEAAHNGNIELVQYLISKGANVHYNRTDQNALIAACSSGQSDVLKVLLDHGADINTHLQFDGTTCMHHACKRGDLEMVKFLLDQGADINILDRHDITPFAIVFEKRNNELITYLLQQGADPNCYVSDHFYGWDPLMSAVYDNDISLMTLLIQYGADLNNSIQMEGGDTKKYIRVLSPLVVACEFGCIDAAKHLLEHGADVNQVFNHYAQNDTSLICLFRTDSWAREQHQQHRNEGDEGEGAIDLSPDQLACLKLLLEYGADLSITNTIGNTVLDYVKGRRGIIRLLNEYIDIEPILK